MFSKTTTEQIQDIQLEFIPVTDDQPFHVTTPRELWSQSTVLFVLIRRPGCSVCRELISDLQKTFADSGMGAKYSLRIVAVLKEVLADDIRGLRKYFDGDLYLDKGMAFYKAITDGKIVKNNLVSAMFNPEVWKGIKRSYSKGVEMGSLGGDSTVFGGLVLANSSGVHFQHNENIGENPANPLQELMDAISKVEDKIEHAPVCNGDSCQRLPLEDFHDKQVAVGL